MDVSAEWPRATEWLGRTMAAMRGVEYADAGPDAAVEGKRVLAEYRGRACGARYAEAVRSVRDYPRELF